MNNWLRDIQYGFRSLINASGITFVVVFCLSLGIGANTAIFSVVNAVVLRPLPFPQPERLVMVWETFRQNQTGSVSYPNLADWKQRHEVFELIAGFEPENHTISGHGEPERLTGGRVTADFFHLLGVNATLGRTFLPNEDQPGGEDVAMLSHALWQRLYQGNIDVIGQSITLDGHPHTIIGVLPPNFEFPIRLRGADIWTAAGRDGVAHQRRDWPMLNVIGRLRPQVTLAGAQTQMNAVQQWLAQTYPETSKDHGIRVVPLHDELVGHVRPLLFTLFGAVGLVLMIACANVANLLLARGGARQKELAIRAALGAGRGRLIRQLLTESLLLSLLGGGCGVLLAFWGMEALVALIPPEFPRIADIRIDSAVFLFTLAIASITALVFGLLPAWRASNLNLTTTLKEGGTTSSSAGRHPLRAGLVVTEIALALVLLIGAGLMLRSFHCLTTINPGFDADNLLTFHLDLGWEHPSTSVDRAELYRRVLERLEAVPGVRAVSAGSTLPLSRMEGFPFRIKHQPTPDKMSDWPRAAYGSVSPGYFRTLGIPLLKGRDFTTQDVRESRPGAVIINEALAQRYWADQDPIGQRIVSVIDIENVDPKEFEIVGIVGNVRARDLDLDDTPCVYAPFQQQTFPYMVFAVRAAGDPDGLIAPIRQAVSEITAREAVFNFRTMSDILEQTGSIVQRRFPMTLLVLFSAVAVLLATIGIYGTLNYAVAQRVHEIGIRAALGATSGDLVRLVLKQGLTLAILGVGAGLIIAWSVTRLLTSLLFGVTATDPLTFIGVPLLIVGVSLVAAYLPARRAARIDPMAALRCE